MEKVINEIKEERRRQDEKWGADRNLNPFIWLAILGEEKGECDKAVLESDFNNYRTELIQVAAVAVAAIESIDKYGHPYLYAQDLY